MFQIALAIFLAGSALAGLSRSMSQLIAFRALQGIGGGGLIVLAQAIVADVVSPRERGRYMGYSGAVFGTTTVLGPILGGFFTDQLSWRWVFYVNIPLGAVVLVLTALVVPSTTRSERRPSLDYAGFALFSIAIVCVVLVTTWGGTDLAWASPTILALVATGAVGITVFVVLERRVPEALLPPRLFGQSVFTVSAVGSTIVGFAMTGCTAFLPLFLQVVSGASPTRSGLVMAPLMGGLLTASIVSGRLITRYGRYRVYPILGTTVATAGLILLGTMGPDTTRLQSGIYMTVLGIGIGLCLQVFVIATQNAVEARDLGAGTAAVNFFRSIGGVIGVAAFGAVFTARLATRLTSALGADQADLLAELASSPHAIEELPAASRDTYIDAFALSLTDVFQVAAVVMAVGLVVSWFLREMPLRSTPISPASSEHDAPDRAAEPTG